METHLPVGSSAETEIEDCAFHDLTVSLRDPAEARVLGSAPEEVSSRPLKTDVAGAVKVLCLAFFLTERRISENLQTLTWHADAEPPCPTRPAARLKTDG